MAQMTVPTLATWCAVYTIADQSSEPYLSYVLHEDEERIDGLKALLSKIDPPDPVPTPGARVWTAPAEAAHQAALRTSMRSLGLGEPAHGWLRHRHDAADGRRGRRRDGRPAPGGPQPRHRHADARQAVRRPLPPGDPGARRGPVPPGRPGPRQRPPVLGAHGHQPVPPAQPAAPGAARTSPGVEVEVIYRAAGEGNEVGGDFYDLFPIRDGAYGFAIGDVCGTGPEAAAVTGLARHALRLLAREGFGGPAVLERLNAAILDEGARSRFLTLLYGELWPQEDGSALLKVVCAGHPLPLRLRQDGTVEPAAEPQPLLGVMDDLELYEQTVTLDPGDVLLCVTDGVTERREGTRMLGDDGLADVLTTCTGLTAGAVAARILRAVERFAVGRPVRRHGHPGDARPGPQND